MVRHVLAAAVATAAFATITPPSAHAVCPITPSTPSAAVSVCASLVGDCVNVAVYYRVLSVSGNTTGGPVFPACPF